MRWLLALWIAGCGFSPTASSSIDGATTGPPGDAAPRFRKQITLAVNSPSELRDFPVSIVTRDADLVMKAQPDASDIAF
ncbi:MAG TPA: hypothetical protein VFQ65_17235, partial [Kofleriaceae bacterium]|nr:hypothetical protein [Kofleriaceae bacterium]